MTNIKAAIRQYLYSQQALVDVTDDTGTLAAGLTAGAISTIQVAGLASAASTGQLLLKNAAGLYELVNYSAVSGSGTKTFTVSATIANSYAIGDYVGLANGGLLSFPAPQETELPYVLINRTATEEIYNRLDSAGVVIREVWQLSVFGATDDTAEAIKEPLIDALNLVNPTTFSYDGFHGA